MKEVYFPHEAILPCGGKGGRLVGEEVKPRIKPLVRAGGRELIRYSLDNLPPRLVNRLVFALGHGEKEIRNWTETANLPYSILFSFQGYVTLFEAINNASSLVTKDVFILCNSDEIRLGLDLERVLRFHQNSHRLATLVIAQCNQLSEQRLVIVNDDGRVTNTVKNPEEFLEKPDEVGLVNAGFMIMHKRALELAVKSPGDGWSCFLDPLCDQGELSAFIDLKLTYFNINTSSQLEEAEDYLKHNPSAF